MFLNFCSVFIAFEEGERFTVYEDAHDFENITLGYSCRHFGGGVQLGKKSGTEGA